MYEEAFRESPYYRLMPKVQFRPLLLDPDPLLDDKWVLPEALGRRISKTQSSNSQHAFALMMKTADLRPSRTRLTAQFCDARQDYPI